MKRSSFKKKIFSLILALIISLGFMSCVFSNSTEEHHISASGGATLEELVKEIKIVWSFGKINILYGDDNKISFLESADEPIGEEDELYYTLDGRALKISFSKNESGNTAFVKDLTVILPKNSSLTSLDIVAITSDIDISGISVTDSISINAMAGSINVLTPKINKIKIDSVSASSVITSKSISEFSFFSQIGDLKLTSSKKVPTGSVSTVFGNTSLILPDDLNADIYFSTTDGIFECDHASATFDNKHMIGRGGTEITVGTYSGNLTISRASKAEK